METGKGVEWVLAPTLERGIFYNNIFLLDTDIYIYIHTHTHTHIYIAYTKCL